MNNHNWFAEKKLTLIKIPISQVKKVIVKILHCSLEFFLNIRITGILHTMMCFPLMVRFSGSCSSVRGPLMIHDMV